MDPLPDLRPYLNTLRDTGLQLRYVIDTHTHADHLSVARALADATGAAYVRYATAPAREPVLRVHDGDHLDLGNVDVAIWHTPGHTPDHISLVVTDRRRGPEPWFVLTGHALMIGDAGRPDLAPTESAADLYQILAKLMTLPDYVEVYPGAYAGST
ncbi:MBL fold metallo-hydrolase [Sulfobacillus harzensis]|uniref:MBL fold metallo-hydrolase n=1 Tax=Sulfobacillus harzensis TaxID=2729629 RepID=UPI0030845A58